MWGRRALNDINFRCAEFYYREAEYNNQAAPDILGHRILLVAERQKATTKELQTFWGAEPYYREAEHNNQGTPDIWRHKALLQRSRIRQPRSPKHLGMQSSAAERRNATTKEPQTFGGAELYSRVRIQQPRSPRYLGAESSIRKR